MTSYQVGDIDLIFELNGLSYGYEDSTAEREYINLDVDADNIWLSANAPEAAISIEWVGGTTNANIEKLANKLFNLYQESSSAGIKLSIFQDDLGKRHALPTDIYKLFKDSKFWLSSYKHITTITRTNLDDRTFKTIAQTSKKFYRIYKKSGMFDLVKQNWTFCGDIAQTDKQSTNLKKHLKTEAANLRAWERSMKRMDMMPSAANTILGKMSRNT